MNFQLFSNEIKKTGFVLENQIAQQLKESGWTVISNKYYVDDLEDSVREIDLVAYRVGKVRHFDVYTALIISCKKSEANIWALLTREINLKDPNADLWPLHAWTNDKALDFQLTQIGKARLYHEQITKMNVTEVLNVPSVEVFAFQEMDKKSGKPQNDKPIFSAITSLMKAQSYELSALPHRKKSPSVYQFNLISLVDTDLVRLMFKDNDIECTSLESEQYLARYIVRKKEMFSRIRFIKANAFKKSLKDYGRLHKANCSWIETEYDNFYDDILKDHKRVNVLIENFRREINWIVPFLLERRFGKLFDINNMSVYWMDKSNDARVGISFPEDILDFMNQSNDIKKYVAKAFKKIYRYEGSFHFEDDIPF